MTALRQVSLKDKYRAESGPVYMTGNQALLRLALLQKKRDEQAGLRTAGYITGYRGSPIGSFDLELARADDELRAHKIVFQPGVNEDLAATAVWGTQQVAAQPDRTVESVFSLWYCKGNGVFRSGDALKHGSFYGASAQGGVLLVPGDDHTAKSSTLAYWSDPEMIGHGAPILYPSSIGEIIEYGLYGWAMSRYSGAWVALKLVNETIEATGAVDLDPALDIRRPEEISVPKEAHYQPHAGGTEPSRTAERMAYSVRLDLARAFARANGLDRATVAASKKRLGIVSAGKAYGDVRRALQILGFDDQSLAAAGISLFKVAMVWPLDAETLREFAAGHEELLVIEKKLPVMEEQIAAALFNLPNRARPRLIGKRDAQDDRLQNSFGSKTAQGVARLIAGRLQALELWSEAQREAFDALETRVASTRGSVDAAVTRSPYFCSGCPHNRSTIVPEGSSALGGIGCHIMAAFIGRKTEFPTQMGGEGHNWVGMTHFVKDKHRFQNLGDGTYSHSGMQAVHAAVVQGVNITYKVLFNDAVAMTGGQAVEGELTVQAISHQALAMGVRRIAVVTDEPHKYKAQPLFARGTTIHERRDLDHVQRQMRDIAGVTMIIYDQTCAAEKRRRRKRGAFPDPQKRLFINRDVCEACGDCSVQSNCMSIETVETEYGSKRVIDQSSCNKDFSCVEGFCPSFVTVYGGQLKKNAEGGPTPSGDDLPEPSVPALEKEYTILINGIGGTGVVTIGAVLGMAAHLQGDAFVINDMTGFAQKGGGVQSHLRLAPKRQKIHSVAIEAGDANLILGCDLVVTAGETSMRSIDPGHTKIVVNAGAIPTAALQQNRDFKVPSDDLIRGLHSLAEDGMSALDATRLAETVMGDRVATNMILVGYAFQRGWIPLSLPAIRRAIELNNVAVAFNLDAFTLGRSVAHDPDLAARALSASRGKDEEKIARSTEEVIARRIAMLRDYQDDAYAETYACLVRKVRKAEEQLPLQRTDLLDAVARNFHKLMAYKDEYEVARLHCSDAFQQELKKNFEGRFKLVLNLAPPLLSWKSRSTGLPIKREFGPWLFPVLRVLARLKFLRGTRFDPFGYTDERRAERRLIDEYRRLIEDCVETLSAENYDIVVELAQLPEDIRGFGHVKKRAMETAETRRRHLLARLAKTDRQPAKVA